MALIIEVISRGHKVIERHKFDSNHIRIGRAYDNDLILSELHVCPHHAAIEIDAEHNAHLIDLNSLNGVYDQQHNQLGDKTVIRSGDVFTLGRAHIRVLTVDHPVAAAELINSVDRIARPINSVWFTGFALLMALIVPAWVQYYSISQEFELKLVFNQVMMVFALGIGWAGIWAFAGHIFKHDARFFAHLSVSLVYLIASSLLSVAVNIVTFNSLSGLVGGIFNAAFSWLLLTALFWFNLYLATVQLARQRLLSAGSVSLLVIALFVSVKLINQSTFSNKPDYIYQLKPPVLRFVDGESQEDFLQDSEALFDRLEKLRNGD